MVTVPRLRAWHWVHTWSSLVCTTFLLLVCLTGLPLLFQDEIDHWLTPGPSVVALPPGTPRANLGHLAALSRQIYPTEVIASIVIDNDAPEVRVWMVPSYAAWTDNPKAQHYIRLDARSGRILEQSKPPETRGWSFMELILRFHKRLFLGVTGELFMSVMALLFIVAIISGVVLYGPFTRKLRFGTVRSHRTQRVRWLDLHNLLGVVTLTWALVVGATGAMNELETPLFAIWQQTDVKAKLASYVGQPPVTPAELVSPQKALDVAKAALPDMVASSIVFPGINGGTPYHYVVWNIGATHLTSRLFGPVLVDARTGKLTAVVRMPWYLRALEVSRPLHFGDYGGLPLKVIWALLDLVTIVVLGSGIYLWLSRRRSPTTAAIPDPDVLEPDQATMRHPAE